MCDVGARGATPFEYGLRLCDQIETARRALAVETDIEAREALGRILAEWESDLAAFGRAVRRENRLRRGG